MISVVIPTYNEGAVIKETLERAAAALHAAGEEFELIVVDDSSADGTAALAEALSRELPIKVLRRPGRLGLATAVRDGWARARGEVLGVMDADLQHPPEVLAELARAMRDPEIDLAIASRYVAGGGIPEWSWIRRLMSWGATHLAASVLPWTLAQVRDPMSGMFFVRASALAGVELSPLGYKILLEVLGKSGSRGLVEVPYVFEERGRGSSKLGARQYVEYLLHLARLARSTGQLRGWIRYVAVGLVGAMLNIAALYLLAGQLGWRLWLALPVAIELALLSNFLWNERLTFTMSRSGVGDSRATLGRLLRYERVCLPGALLNALVTFFLARRGVSLLPAAAAGVVAGGVWNLALNIPAIWRVWGERQIPSRP